MILWIRDCYLAKPDMLTASAQIVAQWINAQSAGFATDNEAVSDKLTKELKLKLKHYPISSEIDAQGITLLKGGVKVYASL